MENNALQKSDQAKGLVATISKFETYRKYERSLTIQKAVEVGIPLRELVRHVDGNDIAVALDLQLTTLVLNLNLKWNLNDQQLKILVEDLIEKYKNETLEDFILCFKKIRMGEYGELTRLDAPIIFSCMKLYLEEKYKVVEDNLMKERDQYYKTVLPESSDRDWLQEWQDAVNKSNGFKEVPKLTQEEIEAEGDPNLKRKVYTYNESEAQINLREAREKLWVWQEMTVRERHPDWTEEQIKARCQELKDTIIYEDSRPKHILGIEKIWRPDKKQRKAI